MQSLIALMVQHGLVLIFAVTLVARLGAPVPAAPLLVVAGALAASHQLLWSAAALASLLANLLGDGAWFWAGHHFGHRVLRLLRRSSLAPDTCVRQSEDLLTRWGGASLVAAKFVPGISVVAPPMAGALGMRWRTFAAFEIISAVLWTDLFMAVGAVFSTQIEQALNILSTTGAVATGVLALLIAGHLGLRYRRRALLRGLRTARVGVAELRGLMNDPPGPVVSDVRTKRGRGIDSRHSPGAQEFPLEDLKRRAHQLPREREMVLYCNCPNEASSARGAKMLAKLGFKHVRPLEGGFDAWIDAGHSVNHYASNRPPNKPWQAHGATSAEARSEPQGGCDFRGKPPTANRASSETCASSSLDGLPRRHGEQAMLLRSGAAGSLSNPFERKP